MPRKEYTARSSWLPLRQAATSFRLTSDGKIERLREGIGRRLMERVFAPIDKTYYVKGGFDEEADGDWPAIERGLISSLQHWHTCYLPAFNRLVSTGELKILFKRMPWGDFEQLDGVKWEKSRVLDWITGHAITGDGIEMFAIHASINVGAKRGRKRKVDWALIKKFGVEWLDDQPQASHAARGALARLEAALSDFIEVELGQSLSESVVRQYASALISVYRRSKAGN